MESANPKSSISDIRHLAKVAGFSLEILDTYGQTRRYSIEERS